MQQKLIILMISLLIGTGERIDFGLDKTTSGWIAVNDGVMGGLSQGSISYTDDALVFQGNLSLENNGGFSSIRTDWGKYDLSEYNKIVMRVKGDGRTYGFVLSHASRYYLPNHKFEFTGKTDEWTTIEMPLGDFHEEIMGRKTGDKINAEILQRIIRMGIILADKKEGPFKLEVDYIEFRR